MKNCANTKPVLKHQASSTERKAETFTACLMPLFNEGWQLEGLSEMSKNYIDDEGFARVTFDENYQFILMRDARGDDYNLLMDSWDTQLACKMIALGYNLDVKYHIDSGIEEGEERSYSHDMAGCLITVMSRILRLAKSAVAIGTINENDTPENWIKWAKTKGYSTDHLSPHIAIERLEDALKKCEIEGVRESYRTQINGLTKLRQLTTTSAPTAAMPATTPTKVIKHKLRRNTLDPLIDKAIKQAGTDKLAEVYLELKNFAIDSESPFTGVIEKDALCYTNDNNEAAKLTKNALDKRLKNRREAPLTDVSGR